MDSSGKRELLRGVYDHPCLFPVGFPMRTKIYLRQNGSTVATKAELIVLCRLISIATQILCTVVG